MSKNFKKFIIKIKMIPNQNPQLPFDSTKPKANPQTNYKKNNNSLILQNKTKEMTYICGNRLDNKIIMPKSLISNQCFIFFLIFTFFIFPSIFIILLCCFCFEDDRSEIFYKCNHYSKNVIEDI